MIQRGEEAFSARKKKKELKKDIYIYIYNS